MIEAALPVSLWDNVMEDDPPVIVKPVDYSTAEQAVLTWHYSRRMPRTDDDYYGCWEPGAKFIGVIIFGSGANMSLGEPYGLEREEVCELIRVALGTHVVPVSQCVTATIRELRQDRPRLRLLVSFADPAHGHHGGIYQAMNWIYAGMTIAADEYVVNGRRIHGRALRSTRSTSPKGDVEAPNVLEWARKVLDPDAERVDGSSKHRYLLPLDKAMRRRIAKLALPYPRGLSVDGDTSAFQAEDVGSTPTDRSASEIS